MEWVLQQEWLKDHSSLDSLTFIRTTIRKEAQIITQLANRFLSSRALRYIKCVGPVVNIFIIALLIALALSLVIFPRAR